MRPRWIVVPVALALALATPFVVFATVGHASGRATTGQSNLDCQSFSARSSSTSTSSSSFTNIGGLEVGVDSVFGMTINVSGVFKGAPIELQVVDTSVGGSFAQPPGPAFLTPPGGSAVAPFSFTWVDPGAPAEHFHTLDVQWKVTSSGTATMTRGDVTVNFQNGNGSGTC